MSTLASLMDGFWRVVCSEPGANVCLRHPNTSKEELENLTYHTASMITKLIWSVIDRADDVSGQHSAEQN